VIRRFLLLALIVMAAGACAPALKDLEPSLGATDSETIWFASAGSLPVRLAGAVTSEVVRLEPRCI
jgi:hypothetical protein